MYADSIYSYHNNGMRLHYIIIASNPQSDLIHKKVKSFPLDWKSITYA